MLYLHYKKNSFINYRGPRSRLNVMLALMMGLFWFFSLVFYSQASLLIGSLGPVIVWPLFMVLIILTANFWGWRRQEWAECPSPIKHKASAAIGFLIVAMLLLTYSATLSVTVHGGWNAH